MTDEEKAKLQELLTEAIVKSNRFVMARLQAGEQFDISKVEPAIIERAQSISKMFSENQRFRMLVRSILRSAIEELGYPTHKMGDPDSVYVTSEKQLFLLLAATVHTGFEIGMELHELGGRIP